VFQELLQRIARAFDRANIPYMVIGGQAVLLYGEPRLTRVIDITVGLDSSGLHRVLAIVRELGLRVLVDPAEPFVRDTMVLPTIEDSSTIRVDIVFSFSAFEQAALERVRPHLIGKTKVRFASLEDLVIHKTVAGRSRDLEDVRVVLLKNPGFDRNYIEHWLKLFDESLTENYLETFRSILNELQS